MKQSADTYRHGRIFHECPLFGVAWYYCCLRACEAITFHFRVPPSDKLRPIFTPTILSVGYLRLLSYSIRSIKSDWEVIVSRSRSLPKNLDASSRLFLIQKHAFSYHFQHNPKNGSWITKACVSSSRT